MERNNYIGNFNPNVNPATTPAIQQFGPGEPIPSLYNSKYNAFPDNLSPRVGVAWDVQGNGKTVVRAGVSILSDFTGLQHVDYAVLPSGRISPASASTNSGTDTKRSIGPQMSGTNNNAHTSVSVIANCS